MTPTRLFGNSHVLNRDHPASRPKSAKKKMKPRQ
jgi:hypothetical protein